MASNPRKKKQKRASKKAHPRSLSEHIKSLPPELEQEVDSAVEDLMQTVSATTNGDVVSTATVKPISVEVTVKLEEEQLKAEKKEKEKELKIDKSLLKSIDNLSKQFDLSTKKKDGLGGFIRDKVANVKNAFSLEGAAGMLGVRREDGSLKGALLSAMLSRQDKKKEKAQFISNFGSYTERGRGIKDKNKLIIEGEKRYNALNRIKEEKDMLEQKAAAARSFGGDISVEDNKRLEKLNRDAGIVAGTSPNGIPKKSSPVMNLLSETVGGMKDEINESTPEEQDSLRALDPEVLRNIFKGALVELVNLSDAQLERLDKLVKNTEVSEEDKLEAKKHVGLEAVTERKQTNKIKEANTDGNGSLVSTIIDGVKDLVSNPLGMIMGSLGVAAVGKRAVGAVSAAASLVKKGAGLVRAAVPVITGAATKAAPIVIKTTEAIAKGAGKGISVAKEAAKIAGAKAVSSGAKAAPIIAKAGSTALKAGKAVLGKLGPIAMLGMAAYDGISGYNNASENLGIEGREATTGEKSASAAGSIMSGLSFGLLDEKALSKSIAGFFGAGPEKLPDVARVRQTQELAAKKVAADVKQAEDKSTSNIVNNAPTTIINNNSSSKSNLPVRNTDSTYNDRMSRHFSFQ